MATIAAPVPVEREFTVRSRSQLQFAARRFVRNPLAMGGLVAFVVMVVAAVAVPPLLPFGYQAQSGIQDAFDPAQTRRR